MNAFLICAFLAFFARSAAAQDLPAAQELLDSAHAVSDLSQIGPYVLTATLVVNPGNKKKEKTGKLTVSRDRDRARIELELDGMREVRVYLGNKQYILNGVGALYVSGLQEVDHIWDPARSSPFHASNPHSFSAVKKEKLHGAEAWCIDKQYARSKTHFCFDPATHVLLTDRTDSLQKEFLEFTTVGQQMYPQKIRSVRTLLAPVELDHITVTPMALEDGIFSVPANAFELEGCDDMKSPKQVSAPDPSFPDEAHRQHKGGEVILYGIVTKEGKIIDAQGLDPDSFGFAVKAGDAMKNWVFKPATCGDHPVNMEMMVTFTFAIR